MYRKQYPNMAAIYRLRPHAELNEPTSTQGYNTLRLTYAQSHRGYEVSYSTFLTFVLALPLAVGITPSESVEHLTQLFNLIKTVIPTDSFYDHGSFNGPELFMTDDNVAERTALFNVWPAYV